MNILSFPAFAARSRGARFAQSWWGNAWLRAVEETSLDSKRLARGRSYAKAGRVGSIAVSPGRLAADVYGSEEMPYRTVVRVDTFSDAQWERLLEQVASRASHIAALLNRTMPHDLLLDAQEAAVPLLPTVGDLEPDCTCQDWGYPCKHAAALCYQASWLLDEDPFVLLLLRGRGENELFTDLRERNVVDSAPPVAPRAIFPADARAAFAHSPGPLPDAGRVGDFHAPALLIPGIDEGELGNAASRAATRARELLGAPPH
ncbi:MAG: hypothetical protein HOQ05_10120 [Corynebacteriales bacterium]|nr:hypothetical protein [Mycobacteriales bacterium]